jgi:hypothetical protein
MILLLAKVPPLIGGVTRHTIRSLDNLNKEVDLDV